MRKIQHECVCFLCVINCKLHCKLGISHHVSDLSSECFLPHDDANFLLAVKVLVELVFFVVVFSKTV